MKTLKKLTFVIVLVCLICNGISFCKEPEKAKPQLKFETTTKTYRIESPNQSRRGGGYGGAEYGGGEYGEVSRYGRRRKDEGETETSNADKSKKIKPTHAIKLQLNSLFQYSASLKPESIPATASWKKMSALQKEFVEQGKTGKFISKRDRRSPRKYYLDATFFAVSEEDAKSMASAFLESLQKEFDEGVAVILGKKAKYEKKVEELKILQEARSKNMVELKNNLEKKSNEGLHSLDGSIVLGSNIMNETRQAARDLYIKLNSANIEIEVIKARLSAATVYQARENANKTVLSKLEEIICEQTIELAGALQRQEATKKILQEEEAIYMLYKEYNQVADEKHQCRTNYLPSAEKNLKRYTDLLKDRQGDNPADKDITATIQPVEIIVPKPPEDNRPRLYDLDMGP